MGRGRDGAPLSERARVDGRRAPSHAAQKRRRRGIDPQTHRVVGLTVLDYEKKFRELDDLSRTGVEDVRRVGIHERRVVREAVLSDDLRRAPRGLPARAAVAIHFGAERAQRCERAIEVGALVVLRLRKRRVVGVRVVCDLVPRREDRVDGLRVPVGRPARDEERRGQRVLGEQAEDVGIRAHTNHLIRFGRLAKLIAIAVAAIALLAPRDSVCADSAPNVVLHTGKAGPRSVESPTERVILRDYRFAWANLEQAMESSSTAPLSGLFVGTANAWLTDAVASQRRNGLSSRYLNQNHKVDAVFYAPEGDMIELDDTADYDLEILDGDKTVHNEHVVVHYVVLMTPAADRWVIRQLQAVPQF